MTFGNNQNQDDNEIEANRMDDDLDYLYGEKPERPIYASRSSLSAEPLPERYDVRSRESQSVATTADNTLLDKECQLETQSGFMLVFKGAKDKATLSVRRKVGTPPSTAVALTPDELRRLSNLVGELSPEPVSRQRVGVGDERPPAESEFDSFVEREYPELAQRRRVKKAFPVSLPEALFELMTEKKLLLGVAAGVSILVLSAVATTCWLSSKPFTASSTNTTAQTTTTTPGASGSLALEGTARSFVLDMLNFRKGSYRQAQIRAMAMMTPELADRYWTETHFPLTKSQLKALPQDQEVRIESITPVTLAVGSYQVDVQGNIVSASGTPPTPIVIRLSIVQDATGKLLVSEQKDITHGVSTAAAPDAASPLAAVEGQQTTTTTTAPVATPATPVRTHKSSEVSTTTADAVPAVAPAIKTESSSTTSSTPQPEAPIEGAPDVAPAPGTASGGNQDRLSN